MSNEDIQKLAIDIGLQTIDSVPLEPKRATMEDPAVTPEEMDAKAQAWIKRSWALARAFLRYGESPAEPAPLVRQPLAPRGEEHGSTELEAPKEPKAIRLGGKKPA